MNFAAASCFNYNSRPISALYATWKFCKFPERTHNYIMGGIIIISLFSHMVIHYVTHIKHVLKWYSSNVNKIMKKNNHL